MKVETQKYLDMCESHPYGIVTWDLEANGLKGDYNSILCGSLKPYGKKPYTFQIKAVGNDQRVVREIGEELEKYHIWITYYGKGFDVPMLNTRRLKWGLQPVEKRHHIDMYYTLKSNTLMGRRSMAAMASFLGTPEQKMGVSQNVWSEMGFKTEENMKIMVDRCESDCAVLEDIYTKTRHLIKDITL